MVLVFVSFAVASFTWVYCLRLPKQEPMSLQQFASRPGISSWSLASSESPYAAPMVIGPPGIRYQNIGLSTFFHTREAVSVGPKFDRKKLIAWTQSMSRNHFGDLPLTIDDYLYHEDAPVGVNWRSGTFLEREKLFSDTGLTYRAYFGILHGHTTSSDGKGTVVGAFETGRDVALLDFLAVTDHSEAWRVKGGPEGTPWKAVHELAKQFSKPDFLGLAGFEYSSIPFGHFTVLNSGHYRDSILDYSLGDFYSWLNAPAQKGTIVFFNHPGFHIYRRPFEFNHFEYDAKIADTIVGLEVLHRNSAYEYMRGYSQAMPYLDEALLHGWDLGSVGGQDNHRGSWGLQDSVRIAPLMSALSEENLWDALRHRRFYATQVQDLQFVVEARGRHSPWYPMGSHLLREEVGEYPLEVRVAFADPSGLEVPRRLEIVSAGKIIDTYQFSEADVGHMRPPPIKDLASPQSRIEQEKIRKKVIFSSIDPFELPGVTQPHALYPRAGEWRFELHKANVGGSGYFYVRFYQGDDAEGFTQSSPIWVE